MIKKSLKEFLQDGLLKAKKKKKKKKKTEKKTSRKTFLTEKFNLGLTTGNKEDPEKVAREMRVV